MADDNTVTINESECPYKGDGLQGWGELMKGFAQSHGRLETEREECSAEQVKDIKNLAEEVATSYTKGMTHLTGAQKKCLVDSISTACADYRQNEWTKLQAQHDVEDITEALFDNYYEKVVPLVLNKQCGKGLYNDTSTQLILGRAYVEAQKEATTFTLQSIKDYFAMYQQLGATLSGFIAQAIQDTTQETFDQTQDRDQTEDGEQKRNRKATVEEEQNNSLNLGDLAVDFGLIAIAGILMEAWITRGYGDCGT